MMTADIERGRFFWMVVLWVARVTSLAAIVPLMLILHGEPGTGPAGAREWIYLLLFPIGFSIGYLMAWRWPAWGGCFSLACMAASLVVIRRTFGVGPYVIWGVLCVPGILFVIAGWRLRERDLIESPIVETR